ncbi:MAG: pyruvoyl-dependent arginine decarboxylase [Halobacteriota archaeon]|nr:pyruvoyl-dependent arginine decarboxylase [Halobacteriota archaeon]
MFIPKRFFVTSGIGKGKYELNAFDLALENAGVSKCNLVPVSSILPQNCREVEPIEIPPGSITFCVIARMDGEAGETIGAGLGYGWLKGKDSGFGIVCEHHGYYSKSHINEILEDKLMRMADMRSLELYEAKFKVESTRVERGNFGSVAVVLIYLP